MFLGYLSYSSYTFFFLRPYLCFLYLGCQFNNGDVSGWLRNRHQTWKGCELQTERFWDAELAKPGALPAECGPSLREEQGAGSAAHVHGARVGCRGVSHGAHRPPASRRDLRTFHRIINSQAGFLMGFLCSRASDIFLSPPLQHRCFFSFLGGSASSGRRLSRWRPRPCPPRKTGFICCSRLWK